MSELLASWLPVFKLALEMTGRPEPFSDYDASRQRCLEEIETAVIHSAQHDVCEGEKDAALFAVVAWFDERVLCSALPWRQRWQSELLQRKYLNTTVAGADFYNRLNELKPTHHQARKVFLFCLQNGFHGQYGTAKDRSELQAIIDQQRKLCLSPDWHSWPTEAPVTPLTPARRGKTPLRRSLLPGAAAAAIILYGLVFLFFYQYIM